MANKKSAEKRNRQNIKRREANRSARSALRTQVRGAREAAASGDSDKAKKAFIAAERAVAKAAAKGLLHKKAAARKISRLAKAMKKK